MGVLYVDGEKVSGGGGWEEEPSRVIKQGKKNGKARRLKERKKEKSERSEINHSYFAAAESRYSDTC